MTAKKFAIMSQGGVLLALLKSSARYSTISPIHMVRSLVICTFVLAAWLGAVAQTAPISQDKPVPTPIPLASPEPQISFSYVHVDGPYVAMTFDDGPSEKLTPKLLDLLAAHHIKATFFVIGENVAAHPEILQRAIREGHEIGNHSWSHPNLEKMSDESVRRQLKMTDDAIVKACGVRPTLMRPPYGSLSLRQKRWIHEEFGYRIILWDVDPLDWKRPGPKIVASRVIKQTQPGSIVLSHDIHPGTIAAEPEILSALEAKGFKFVTVSELIAMAKPVAPKPQASVAPSASPIEFPPHN